MSTVMIPISEPGSDMSPTEMLAPGVYGYAMVHGDDVYVPYVRAAAEGSGVVGAWIDALPDWVCFPNVISGRLAGMLRRRDYHIRWEWAEVYKEWCDIWDKRLARDELHPGEPKPDTTVEEGS